MATVETRAVLAAAYARPSAMLTHAVRVEGGRDVAVLCRRVRLEHLADAYALTTEGQHTIPTCPACAAKWRNALKNGA